VLRMCRHRSLAPVNQRRGTEYFYLRSVTDTATGRPNKKDTFVVLIIAKSLTINVNASQLPISNHRCVLFNNFSFYFCAQKNTGTSQITPVYGMKANSSVFGRKI
jgi:hypothetical protein